jgi:tetratricopeptide (TPR) repeat protein
MLNSSFNRALKIQEKIVGGEHKNTAYCLRALGNIKRRRNQFKEAHDFYNRALTIIENTYGTRHKDFALTLKFMGILAR